MRNRSGWISSLFALAVLAGGCARTALPDAYYASALVPLYPRVELRDMMGSRTTGEEPEEVWDGTAWFLTSKDEFGKIVAFYDYKLAGWKKEVCEDGETRFTTVPEGADEGEEVYVVIRPSGDIQIGESVRAGKRHSTDS